VTVQLFINHLEGQAAGLLPPEARSLLLPNREAELREWQAIEHIYRERLFEQADHTALLSPKFPVKTGLSFDQVVSFIRDNPGHDVYLFDHGAQFRYYTYSLFEQSEASNPGFVQKFIACLGQIGEIPDVAGLGRSLPGNCICGNGWVGNARFWREVVGDAARLIAAIRSRPAVWRMLCEPTVLNGHVYPQLPMILERFVPWWLMTRGGLSVTHWPYDKAYVLARCVRPREHPVVEGLPQCIAGQIGGVHGVVFRKSPRPPLSGGSGACR
jgi:hypothetical protein